MTAFVVLAAGRGTRIGRVGESLHKALVPLGNRAVISHLLDLAPDGARVVVCTGHRASQVEEYLTLAHPQQSITYVAVDGWDRPGGGPGASLLAAREAVGDDDMIFTSCDTLWRRDMSLWDGDNGSWVAVAPIPAGTPASRWCRVRSRGGTLEIKDKEPGVAAGWDAYTGLSRIARADLEAFWYGLEKSGTIAGEKQVSGGLATVAAKKLWVQNIEWTDVGDEDAYRTAVARWEGYDWTKPEEATYVLAEAGRVVKFFADREKLERRRKRAEVLAGAVPPLVGQGHEMLAYEYVPGVTGYRVAEARGPDVTRDLLAWADRKLWTPVSTPIGARETALRFYRDKTMERAMMLDAKLRGPVLHAASRLDWDELVAGVRPARVHGDLNLGNVIVAPHWTTGSGSEFTGIDWREDWGGSLEWGDMRYDVAKLLAGMEVHWGRARTGDMRPWRDGDHHADAVREWWYGKKSGGYAVETIAALSLLNSAPLHAPPLDEILVARGTAWLERRHNP